MDRSTKEKILAMLETNRGRILSGSTIGGTLGISRAAVWKAIGQLRKDGHQIHAVQTQGYTLAETSDLLSRDDIFSHLSTAAITPEQIILLKTTESTNRDAKSHALNGAPHGTVILAEEQTKGRGRLGRSFYSPAETGLYMSFILRPTGTLSSVMPITQAAAVACCRALSETANIETEIKWVNDLFLDNRKVGGILTEAISDVENGLVNALILGVGINVHPPRIGFPEDLVCSAGALSPSATTAYIRRNSLAASIIDHLLSLFDDLSSLSFLPEYESRCFLLGRDVIVHQGDSTWTATATGLDPTGGLILRNAEKEEVILRSGDVSLRLSKEES